MSPERLREVRERLEGEEALIISQVAEAQDLPPRPPVLCPGCPHRGVFIALGKFDVIVTGDIGCYSLGVLPPLSRMDTILCMGGGVSLAHGMAKAGEKRKIVGMVGDSTFFHSGITGLLDIASNKSNVVICVVDNRTTAMTGHQDHPGTGRTLMGEKTVEASIEEIVKACGIKRVFTVNPYNSKEITRIFKEELACEEPSVIISRAPCPLAEKITFGKPLQVKLEKCTKCGACIRIGCPAIEAVDRSPNIKSAQCISCTLCKQACKFDAIQLDPDEAERVLL